MLAVRAPLMLMDEPIANVDIQHQSKWFHAVRETTRQGNTVVSVLHDLNLALRADQVIVMQDGRVVLQSTTDDPQLHQCLQQTFEQRLRFHRLADRWVVVPD
jgi:iron complex transport system ATP-binding protein